MLRIAEDEEEEDIPPQVTHLGELVVDQKREQRLNSSLLLVLATYAGVVRLRAASTSFSASALINNPPSQGQADNDVFYLFLKKQKRGAELHINLEEGTYHTVNQITTSHRWCGRAGRESHDGKANDDEGSRVRV